jgi:hypothetical protein
MKPNILNLKFEYLHRDGGNYKLFGSIILENTNEISAAHASGLLNKKLIDSQYFYPKETKVPLFEDHKKDSEFFTDWYEFEQFSYTEEKGTNFCSVEEFIQSF